MVGMTVGGDGVSDGSDPRVQKSACVLRQDRSLHIRPLMWPIVYCVLHIRPDVAHCVLRSVVTTYIKSGTIAARAESDLCM
jgi:hypothetical protein